MDKVDEQARFKMHDRVRVKYGAERGHYGTVVHVGGDNSNYYGVKLDADREDCIGVGYSDYELDRA